MGLIGRALLTTVACAAYPVVSSAISARKVIEKAQLHSEKSKMKQLSKVGLSNLKSILSSKDMPLEVCLLVFICVLSPNVLCFDEMTEVIQTDNPVLIDTIVKHLHLKLIAYPLRCITMTYGEKSIWRAEMADYPRQFIFQKKAKKLISFMKKHDMHFKSALVDTKPRKIYFYEAAVDFTPYITESINISEELKFDSYIFPPLDPWPASVTFLRLHETCGIRDINTFIKLKEVVLMTKILVHSETVASIAKVLHNQKELKIFKVEYWHMFPNPSDNEPGSDPNGSIQQVKENLVLLNVTFKTYPKIKHEIHCIADIEVDMNSEFDIASYMIRMLNFQEQDPWPEEFSTVIQDNFYSLNNYFTSIQLPHDSSHIERLNWFPNLTKLLISKSMEVKYTPKNIPYMHQNIKHLTITNVQISGLNGNFKGLSSLQTLRIEASKVGSTLFEMLAPTVIEIELYTTDILGTMIVPRNLQSLTLCLSYPHLDCTQRAEHSPGLNLTFLKCGHDGASLNNIVKVIMSAARAVHQIRFEFEYSHPESVSLVRSTPKDYKDDGYECISCEFTENLKTVRSANRFCKLCYFNLNSANHSFRNIIGDVSLMVLNSMVFLDNLEIADSGSGSGSDSDFDDDRKTSKEKKDLPGSRSYPDSFETLLKATNSSSFFAGLGCEIETVESSRPIPALYKRAAL
ncbi:unnamed protein product [Ambrosiozyma monospora]|uniref:Unnamed protein product n=1 Tax=Ambrosiozyma monospora TaxID=43982 RepID=A0A9W7DLV1_AMBMO|nr:unnamed protein product [Ambrosiozyma monospora]